VVTLKISWLRKDLRNPPSKRTPENLSTPFSKITIPVKNAPFLEDCQKLQ
jgi:hypothetical protein